MARRRLSSLVGVRIRWRGQAGRGMLVSIERSGPRLTILLAVMRHHQRQRELAGAVGGLMGRPVMPKGSTGARGACGWRARGGEAKKAGRAPTTPEWPAPPGCLAMSPAAQRRLLLEDGVRLAPPFLLRLRPRCADFGRGVGRVMRASGDGRRPGPAPARSSRNASESR